MPDGRVKGLRVTALEAISGFVTLLPGELRTRQGDALTLAGAFRSGITSGSGIWRDSIIGSSSIIRGQDLPEGASQIFWLDTEPNASGSKLLISRGGADGRVKIDPLVYTDPRRPGILEMDYIVPGFGLPPAVFQNGPESSTAGGLEIPIATLWPFPVAAVAIGIGQQQIIDVPTQLDELTIGNEITTPRPAYVTYIRVSLPRGRSRIDLELGANHRALLATPTDIEDPITTIVDYAGNEGGNLFDGVRGNANSLWMDVEVSAYYGHTMVFSVADITTSVTFDPANEQSTPWSEFSAFSGDPPTTQVPAGLVMRVTSLDTPPVFDFWTAPTGVYEVP